MAYAIPVSLAYASLAGLPGEAGKGVLLAAVLTMLLLLRRASRPRVLRLGRLPGSDRFVDALRYAEHELD